MPSYAHQCLMLWIARKMAVDGYLPGGYDGPSAQGGIWNMLPRPFEMHEVRPDVWGMSSTGDIALGEAKTASDVDALHTVRQLSVFGKLRNRATGRQCRLYVAVPQSAAHSLDLVLIRSGLHREPNVVCLNIPDCLILEERL